MTSKYMDTILRIVYKNFETVLQRFQDINLALNWEKCHFMVTEGIALGHKISIARLEVDQAKVVVIKTLIPLITVNGIRSFLGHASFYKRFIRTSQKSPDHYVRCWKKMQNLILMKHANFHLKKSNPD